MIQIVFAALAGVVFAIGLAFSGMLQPAKVQGFLNLAGLWHGISWQGARGYWDPSLMLVMASALVVTFLGFRFTPRPGKDFATPWAADAYQPPADRAADKRLIAGSALFGIGWALAGYCPGPALASITSSADALLFCSAMLVAMWATKHVLMHIDGEMPGTALKSDEDDED